ncbi:hypothetical protein F5Y17DRAFT_411684 [Xylariaceae sp. FL0594]|nr:hypothetical protein F5Y17DRAFT_411684 [Xylariaceae sp. FL0594]
MEERKGHAMEEEDSGVGRLPALPPDYATVQKMIDDAHAEDPKTVTVTGGVEVPCELRYAQKMTRWLAVRCPDASPALQIACRAQHFRRWELPRDRYPMTRAGYLTWRARQKTQAAEKIKALLISSTSTLDVDRIAALVRKDNLAGDAETQVLEDVACLVFLDDHFDDFDKRDDVDEAKMVNILRKTWAKMTPQGREIALGMRLSERAKALVGKALQE